MGALCHYYAKRGVSVKQLAEQVKSKKKLLTSKMNYRRLKENRESVKNNYEQSMDKASPASSVLAFKRLQKSKRSKHKRVLGK